jgi:hypothetical protein
MSRRNRFYEPERPLEPPEKKDYYCQWCGAENPECYYRDRTGQIIGCEHCIDTLDAAEWEDDHAE